MRSFRMNNRGHLRHPLCYVFTVCLFPVLFAGNAGASDPSKDSVYESLLSPGYSFSSNLTDSANLRALADSVFDLWCYHAAYELQGDLILKSIDVVQDVPSEVDWTLVCELRGNWNTIRDEYNEILVTKRFGALFWYCENALFVDEQFNAYEIHLVRRGLTDRVILRGSYERRDYRKKIMRALVSNAPGNEWQQGSARFDLSLHRSADISYSRGEGRAVSKVTGMLYEYDSGLITILPPEKLGVLTSDSDAHRAWRFLLGED